MCFAKQIEKGMDFVMKKVIKIGFPIVCVAVIGGTFILLGKLDKKVEGSLKNKDYNTISNESAEENFVNETLNSENVTYTVPVDEENVTNDVEENVVNNATNSNNETTNGSNTENTANVSNIANTANVENKTER